MIAHTDGSAGRSFTSNERRTRRNGRAWLLWLLPFTATFVVGGRIFRYADWAPDGTAAVVLSFVPLLPGAMAFRAFLRFAREADEMLRDTLIEGLLFGFALAMIFWGAIQLPEHVWLPKMSADATMAVLLLGTWIGIVRAQWRRK